MKVLLLWPDAYQGPLAKTDKELAEGFMLSDYFRRWKRMELPMWYAICLYISKDLDLYSTEQTWEVVQERVYGKLGKDEQVKLA